MQFQITEPRTVTIRSVTSRVERHGEEKQPAVSIWLVMAAPNALLDMLDPELKGMFWKRPATGDLPGVEEAPVTDLRCKLVKGPHKVEKAYDGYTLTICHLDGSEQLTLDACKVNGFEFLPQPDGMCRLAFKVDAAEDDPETRGTLDTMLQREVDITLVAPAVREPSSATVTDIFANTGNAEQGGTPAG